MMNFLKTFGRTETASAETVRALEIEEMTLVSGGIALRATDPTNPLCPEPRRHPDFGNHHK